MVVMKARFFSEPYDGLELESAEINIHCDLVPISRGSGVRLFLMMPPLEHWDDIVAGRVSKESVGDHLHPYERVKTDRGFEYHDAAANGTFEQAVNERPR